MCTRPDGVGVGARNFEGAGLGHVVKEISMPLRTEQMSRCRLIFFNVQVTTTVGSFNLSMYCPTIAVAMVSLLCLRDV